ncbi:GNAT family N-acetyltransferase [Brevibacterium luteolum]|uniref:GNAT family N-acetyltransferase n=1 Tax=Brevibacterium luteolum TaxID=199591 RepID=UPI001C246580|nr:GNAT family N-acetyltransferase [Brevibacterium luteolum]MBU8579650.1 GNAT family N-acetyltransferase [Brevibacterium luteolum]
MTYTIRFARAGEAATLSALALRSKGHWDYSADFLELCRHELTYTAEECGSGDVFVAEQDGQVLGFAAIDGTPPAGDLEALFVDVGAMGRGVGGGLLQHVLKIARNRGFTSLTHFTPTPGPNRSMPIMERFGSVKHPAGRFQAACCLNSRSA